MSIRIYIAGKVTGRSTKDVREERLAAASAIRRRGWVPIDPIGGEYEALKGRRNIRDDHTTLTKTSIARKDRYGIEHSDMLIWLTSETASFGSCIEVGFTWGRNQPVFALHPDAPNHPSAFVEHICVYIGVALEDVLDFIQDYMIVDDVPAEDAAE